MRKGIRLKSSQVVSLLQYETCVLLSIILRLFCPVLGTFDVILPTREVQVVLGMSREIAYIRNGKINTNAAKFVIPVSQDLDAVHLAWRMRPNSNRGAGDNTDSTTVSYRIFIESTTTSSAATSRSAEDAMYQPSLNVSHQGRLSIKEEIVRISLPCTGRVHATVDVDITIHFEVSNMDDQDSSNIELNLKRQKTCTTENTHNGMHGHDGADQEWHTNGKPDVTFLAIILSAFIIMIFTILFIVIVNWKGCEFIFGIAISNDKTTATTTTISSNPNKNNAHFLVCHNIDHKFSHQTGVNNEDITNPYEAIMTQNQPLIQEPNVLTYNDAGLLTMDPRSGGALSSMQLSEQPPLPPLPPPMSANQHYMRNCVGTRGVGGVFTGNKFEFVTADFNSDAESRVTDWVNQHQKQHETLNTVDRGFNVVEAHDQRGKTEHASLAANYPDENDNASGDDNVNERAEMLFENLQVDRHRLKLGCLLQEGTFGRVYQGLFQSSKTGRAEKNKNNRNDIDTDENSGNDISEQDETEDTIMEIDIIIKTVLSGSSQTQINLMVQEGVQLLAPSKSRSSSNQVSASKHILIPLATTWDGTSPMLIYLYPSHGNLKQYLTKFANAGLSTHQVVKMGVQLLTALGHLHKRGILHKDVSARNCYLNDGSTLQLADAALSRDLFPGDYHCLGDNENRPIKWMPVEAIQKTYSRASDIWSFGVF